MQGKKGCPAPGWVGIDVSKKVFDAAIWGDQAFKDMVVAQFKRTRKGAGQFVHWLSNQARKPAGAVMEWTGSFSRELAQWIQDVTGDLPISLMNPCLVKAYGRSLNLRNKTDAVDARMLAAFGHERRPSPWVRPSPEQDRLQSLFRTRAKLVEIQSTLDVRAESCLFLDAEAEAAQRNVLDLVRAEVKVLEEAIRSLASQFPRLGADFQLLRSIPGVGLITAAAVLAEAGDLRRFRRGRQLTAFLGVSPKRYESGSSVRGRTRMSRMGGTHIRPVLYMAAVASTRLQGPMRDFYQRLVNAGKPPLVAIGALMRKMLLVMRAVLIQNKPYAPKDSDQSQAGLDPTPAEGQAAKVQEAGMIPQGSWPSPGLPSGSAAGERPSRAWIARALANP